MRADPVDRDLDAARSLLRSRWPQDLGVRDRRPRIRNTSNVLVHLHPARVVAPSVELPPEPLRDTAQPLHGDAHPGNVIVTHDSARARRPLWTLPKTGFCRVEVALSADFE